MDHSAHGGSGTMAAASGTWVLESELASVPRSTSFCSGGGTVMQNGFSSSFSNGFCVVWLFEGFVLDSAGKYIGALILTFLLAFANETIRFFRARALQEKAPFTSLTTVSPATKDGLLALGYACQMLVAYWIMLLVMTYEVLIFVAILTGLLAGYLSFNRFDNRRKRDLESSCECAETAVVATKVLDSNGNGKAASSTVPVNAGTPCCGGV
jgi:Ctr copper transporter family